MSSTQASLTIKASNDKKYHIQIALSRTVAELKTEIAEVSSISADKQRLIYSGRILSKEDESLEGYRIKDGNTIHLVQSRGATTPSTTNSGAADTSRDVNPTIQGTTQIPMAAGTGNANPLTGLTGARYAGQVGLPSASMFGADGGMTGFPGGIDNLEEMLSQPGVREAMDAAFSNPQFIDMMMASNPQLRDAPPYVRQMLQSEQFRRQMLDPAFLRQMQQMQQIFGGGSSTASASFPAPGSTDGSAATSSASGAQTSDGSSEFPAQANDIGALLGALGRMPSSQPTHTGPAGGGTQQATTSSSSNSFPQLGDPAMLGFLHAMANREGITSSAQGDTRPVEERFADQLRQLNDMGFFEFDRNVAALRRSGGSVQGAIEALLNGSV
ncbi:hypothetical protein PYCC9005_001063 [Savitreella phatthalungensis]